MLINRIQEKVGKGACVLAPAACMVLLGAMPAWGEGQTIQVTNTVPASRAPTSAPATNRAAGNPKLSLNPQGRTGTAPATLPAVDFSKLSIEELMDVEVISSGMPTRKSPDVAGGIGLITQENAQYSRGMGVRELLRLDAGADAQQFTPAFWTGEPRGPSLWAVWPVVYVEVDDRECYGKSVFRNDQGPIEGNYR